MKYYSKNPISIIVPVFQDKYFAKPGDMRNAIDFWGDDTSLCDDGNASNNGTPGTCNGDGNGHIQETFGPTQAAEGFLMWNHLALAGLIQGEYSGQDVNWGYTEPNINVPVSQFDGDGCYHLEDDAPDSADGGFDIEYGRNFIEYGRHEGEPWKGCENPVLVPEDAWNIDKKMDDGKPARGIVIGQYWNMQCANATTANTELDADYLLR